MIILANVMNALAYVLNSVIGIVILTLVLQALMSWLSPNPHSQIYRTASAITDPILRPLRARMPVFQGIDLSPLVMILILVFIQMALVQSLEDYAMTIRAEVARAARW